MFKRIRSQLQAFIDYKVQTTQVNEKLNELRY